MKKIYRYIGDNFLFKRFPTLKLMTKFAMVGVVNLSVDFSLYLFLTRALPEEHRLHYLTANFIAFCGGATSSYFFNKHWTFRNKDRNIGLQYAKFFSAAVVGLFINQTVLYSLVEFAGLFDLLSKAAAVVAGYFWNFYINNKWTFANKEAVGKNLPE